MTGRLVVRELGLCDYEPVWRRMQEFTATRDVRTADEIWILQHHPVFTRGTSSRDRPGGDDDIPLVHSDRGGQITYHGPGQLIAYLMLDVKRRGSGPKKLVREIEQVLIELLASRGIPASRRSGAPGVYVEDRKIAALGLRIRRNCSYHGLSLNVDMDLSPYERIDPCGYPGLAVTRMKDLVPDIELDDVSEQLKQGLLSKFSDG